MQGSEKSFLLLFSILLIAITISAQKRVKKEIGLEMSFLKSDPVAAKRWKGNDSLPDIEVIIKNNTDTLTSFYEDWNAWGQYAIRFELERGDSLVTLFHSGCSGDKNFPSAELLFPGDSLILYYTIQNCTQQTWCYCFFTGRKHIMFPKDNLLGATIRVVYHNDMVGHDSLIAQKSKYFYPFPNSKHLKRLARLSKGQIIRSFVRDKLISPVHRIPFDAWRTYSSTNNN